MQFGAQSAAELYTPREQSHRTALRDQASAKARVSFGGFVGKAQDAPKADLNRCRRRARHPGGLGKQE
ncbi:MAG: hypothetical protein R3E96_03875 [Planctomycetota bacterium]